MKQNHILLYFLFFLNSFLIFSVDSPAVTTQKKIENGDVTRKKQAPEGENGEQVSRTTHVTRIDGEKLKYTAVAGRLFLKQHDVDDKARIFYVSYEIMGTERSKRPVTFAFNGGPGAASVWLHFGGLGPKRIRLTDDGKVLPPPVEYGDNPYSWLSFTDLVFVDPVGTGFSKSIPDDKETSKNFYGFKEDIESVAAFIRLYLTRNNRWTSPLFLVGESYGTTRVSGLTWHLQQRYGIGLNGVILVSPVLDFDTVLFHPSNDLPYLLFFPTYTAVAWHHKVLPHAMNQKKLKHLLDEVEDFCLKDYIVFLAKGENVNEEERNVILQKMIIYTGLSAEFIKEHNFRISWMDFTKNLLKERKQIVGRMDGTITGIDPAPANPFPIYDPSLDTLYAPFSSAVNSYVREVLKFKSDLFYEFLNTKVNESWDWSSGIMRKQGFIDVSHRLRDAIAVSKDLKVLIASGLYDLATPYFAAKYTVSHMWLGKQKPNVLIRHYKAGHMMYTHSRVLQQFSQDVEKFYKNTLEFTDH